MYAKIYLFQFMFTSETPEKEKYERKILSFAVGM